MFNPGLFSFECEINPIFYLFFKKNIDFLKKYNYIYLIRYIYIYSLLVNKI